MKIIKITHYRGDDEYETSESIWFESPNIEEIKKQAKRLVDYILPCFEGLNLIAEGIDNDVPWKTFSEGLSKYSYSVRVEVRP